MYSLDYTNYLGTRSFIFQAWDTGKGLTRSDKVSASTIAGGVAGSGVGLLTRTFIASTCSRHTAYRYRRSSERHPWCYHVLSLRFSWPDCIEQIRQVRYASLGRTPTKFLAKVCKPEVDACYCPQRWWVREHVARKTAQTGSRDCSCGWAYRSFESTECSSRSCQDFCFMNEHIQTALPTQGFIRRAKVWYFCSTPPPTPP